MFSCEAHLCGVEEEQIKREKEKKKDCVLLYQNTIL